MRKIVLFGIALAALAVTTTVHASLLDNFWRQPDLTRDFLTRDLLRQCESSGVTDCYPLIVIQPTIEGDDGSVIFPHMEVDSGIVIPHSDPRMLHLQIR
jgi:hypothetical protein